MAWGSVSTSGALDLSGTMQDFDLGNITLNPGETAHVQISYNPQGTPTEFLEWQLLASPDDGTTYDVTVYDGGTLNNDVDPRQVSVLVSGIRSFKVQARLIDTDGTDGGDDTDAEATLRVRLNGVSL